MLDSLMRPMIDPPLKKMGGVLAGWGVSANMVTFCGFFAAICAFAAIAQQAYGLSLALIIFNRFMDGLDGAVARVTRPKKVLDQALQKISGKAKESGETDLGGFLDIVTDFVVYSGFVFFFALGQFEDRPEVALYAAFLIFSYVGSGVSFLSYAIIAAKRKLETTHQGKKSFFYMSGLAEGTETILFMLLICLFPAHFPVMALVFGTICWITAIGRVWQAIQDFSD
jgi:phosphatidylglycerophosphate synthase